MFSAYQLVLEQYTLLLRATFVGSCADSPPHAARVMSIDTAKISDKSFFIVSPKSLLFSEKFLNLLGKSRSVTLVRLRTGVTVVCNGEVYCHIKLKYFDSSFGVVFSVFLHNRGNYLEHRRV